MRDSLLVLCVDFFFKAGKGSFLHSREFPIRPGTASSILRVISSCGTCPSTPSHRGRLFWRKVHFCGVQIHPELMSDTQARMCLPKTAHTAGGWRGASRKWLGIMGIAMPHV